MICLAKLEALCFVAYLRSAKKDPHFVAASPKLASTGLTFWDPK